MEISRQHSHFLRLIFVWDWQHFVLIRMLYFLKERTDTMRYSIRCFSIAWPLSSGWSVLILFTAMLRTERCEAAMLLHVREHLRGCCVVSGGKVFLNATRPFKMEKLQRSVKFTGQRHGHGHPHWPPCCQYIVIFCCHSKTSQQLYRQFPPCLVTGLSFSS